MKTKYQDDLRKLVNSSGFPFQLGVENEVKNTQQGHGWKVISREHPWQHLENGSSGYIDLLLENRHGTQLMVIECKRVRDAEWVFLVPTGKFPQRRHARCWMTYLRYNNEMVGWYDITLDPRSPEAEFCVIRGQNKDKPMLERISAELVDATESAALEDIHLQGSEKLLGNLRLFIPIIITTAKLQVCQFSLDNISIANGELTEAEFTEVPFVRFRKSLTTKFPKDRSPQDLTEFAEENERTIFVINANSFIKVLKEWEIDLAHG